MTWERRVVCEACAESVHFSRKSDPQPRSPAVGQPCHDCRAAMAAPVYIQRWIPRLTAWTANRQDRDDE